MTLPAASLVESHHSPFESTSRPAKRVKTHDGSVAAQVDTKSVRHEESTLVRRHPLGVKPSGNALTSPINLKAACGLFARWPDELIALFLETLNVPHVLRLGATCRALHAFTRNEELWRMLFIESSPSSFSWQGTWRSTFLAQPSSNEPRVNCSNLFSDLLHRPFFCAHVPLVPYIVDIPAANSIPRLADLTLETFSTDWYNSPFILTSPVKEWPIYHSWSLPHLLASYPHTRFRAESVDWPLQTYMDYMTSNSDESPLYLFDRSFAEKMSLLIPTTRPNPFTSSLDPAIAYWPPSCFGDDIFSLLGPSRPDHRWLIVGPARSGSTFHVDPNATSAWNAVITGSKYWIMFPPSQSPPPGVYVSADKSEVTSPLSIAEWLLAFHAEARQTLGCKEGICHAGEVLHVPSGWFHLVLNLEPSIAVTQNFVPRRRVGAVLRFLREQRESVSGFKQEVADPYALFVEKLRAQMPEVLEEGLVEAERSASKAKSGRGKWEELTKVRKDGEDGEGGGFAFGFGFGGDDDGDEE